MQLKIIWSFYWKIGELMDPSVTILLTVKNSKDTIKRCIESLLNLNYKNYEIYVTDAYSDDGTFEILSNYEDKIKLERVKGNISSAYNYMIKKVNAKYIAFTDADCVVDRDWLRELISGFSSEKIVGVAGFCSTPKDVDDNFQRVVGKELEKRFKNLPKYLQRAPTMNFAVRSKIAKKVKFDESLDVSQETDWGYRLNKYGKILYNPSAKVFHYHRSNPKDFFRQQRRYGKFVVKTYLEKHKNKIFGDSISTFSMFFQIPIFWFLILSLILSFLNSIFLFSFFIFFGSLIIIYLKSLFEIKPNKKEIPSCFLFLIIRTVAWSFGVLQGVLSLILGSIRGIFSK